MENTKETTAQKYLRLLSDIPAEDFIAGWYSNEKDKCCAMGHIERLSSHNPKDYSSRNCMDNMKLRTYSNEFLLKHKKIDVNMSFVNDNVSVYYPEPEIKDRVIHLLKDMVEAGY